MTYSTGGEGNGATAGSASTGDGGDSDLNDSGENGGSGIVVVRYAIGTAKASGGSVSFHNGKTIHTFTSSGAFASSNAFNETCECVIVGGGGGSSNPSGGGSHGAGGGGAGAVYDRDNISLNLSGPWTFNVTVGGGGAVGSSGNKGSAGAASVVAFPTGTLTAPGGGAGAISASPSSLTAGNPGGAGVVLPIIPPQVILILVAQELEHHGQEHQEMILDQDGVVMEAHQ